MRPLRFLFPTVAALALALALQDASRAHGGTFRGPGDSVPPSGSASSGGGGGGTGGSTAGGAPRGPGGPSGGSTSAGAGAGTGPSTGSTSPSSGPQAGAAGSSGGAWSQWWELNKDLYLDLKARIYDHAVEPGSASFFLGGVAAQYQRDSLQPTPTQIQKHVVPALLAALATETHNEIITGCLIALAKTGRTESAAVARTLETAFLPFLADRNQEIAETAALALGILGHDAGRSALIELLLDTERAQRDLVNRSEVHYRTRAFAAYGLSIIGSRTNDEAVRSEIVAALFRALRQDRSAAKDVRVASLVALGRVPLETVALPPGAAPRGEWAPESCRLAQFDAVLAYFESSANDFLVRAHAPATLVELLRGLPPSDANALKDVLADRFGRRIRREVSEPREIVQGCVIALGLVADSDDDEVDRTIRGTLLNIDDHVADTLARNFAIIALAQIAARPGDRSSGKGRAEIEREIASRLVGGTSERPWGALAIGVLGRADIDAKRTPSLALSRHLLESLETVKAPDELGAHAIAAGMVGLEDALPIIRKKLEDVFVEDARGYLVLAMGLIGGRDSIQLVQ
jgi:hypothetical protein